MRRLPLALVLVALLFAAPATGDLVYRNGVGLKPHEKATFEAEIRGRPSLAVWVAVRGKAKSAGVDKHSPSATFYVRGVRVRVRFNAPTLRVRVVNRKRHKSRVAVEVHQ